MRRNVLKTAVRRIVSVGILLILLFAMQRLVMPKYVDDVIEGGFTAEYYRPLYPVKPFSNIGGKPNCCNI